VTKIRDEAFFRLQHRAARLKRLVDLEAPDLILMNEVLLLAESAEMLAPDAWHAHAARVAVGRHKRLLHLCEHDDCEEAVAWIPSAATPTCPGPFHATSCLKHALELDNEADAYDIDDDLDDDEVEKTS
jgi:hypothetical protein